MRATALALGALLVGGCGGPSVNDAVSTATAWLIAVRDHDAKKACGYMDKTAAIGLAAKFVPSKRGRPCEEVVTAYRSRLSEGKLKTLLAAPLESTGRVTKDRLGVFPHATRYQFEVVLMRKGDDGWTVAGVGIAPG